MTNLLSRQQFGEIRVLYVYLRGKAQPTTCKAFWIGEALGSKSNLNSGALDRAEICGLLFVAIAGRLTDFVKIVAEIYRRHPHLNAELIDLLSAIDDLSSSPRSYRERASPLFSPSTHQLISEVCYDVFKPAKREAKECAELVIDLNNEQMTRFGAALHASKNESVPLRERTQGVRMALTRALALMEWSYMPTEEEVRQYYEAAYPVAD